MHFQITEGDPCVYRILLRGLSCTALMTEHGKSIKSVSLLRPLAAKLLAVVTLPILFITIYLLAIRPTQLRWGATAEEVARSMPGDALVPHPAFCATRGITIEGKPEDIWPWLVQMGYDRAGFYGYDLIENIGSSTGIRSAESILSALQHPKTGDELPISAVARVKFGDIDPDRYLTWQSDSNPPTGAFTWALYPIDQHQTRLISRVRLRYHWTGSALLLDLFTEFADHVAVPKILEGIKSRVEARASEQIAWQIAAIGVWMMALAEFAVATVLIFRRSKWSRLWLLALSSGSLLLFALYSHAPVWIGATLGGGIAVLMLLSSRKGAREFHEV